MYRKHIEHAIMVGLKYFFDLDYNFCSHLLIGAVVIMGLFKFFISDIGAKFYDGLLTVKEDALNIKMELATVKENWYRSEMKENLVNNLRSLKNLVPDKLSW
jgi:hypothetical protein